MAVTIHQLTIYLDGGAVLLIGILLLGLLILGIVKVIMSIFNSFKRK